MDMLIYAKAVASAKFDTFPGPASSSPIEEPGMYLTNTSLFWPLLYVNDPPPLAGSELLLPGVTDMMGDNVVLYSLDELSVIGQG